MNPNIHNGGEYAGVRKPPTPSDDKNGEWCELLGTRPEG